MAYVDTAGEAKKAPGVPRPFSIACIYLTVSKENKERLSQKEKARRLFAHTNDGAAIAIWRNCADQNCLAGYAVTRCCRFPTISYPVGLSRELLTTLSLFRICNNHVRV